MRRRLFSRREALAGLAGLVAAPSIARATSHQASAAPFAKVVPGYRIHFPRDEGSHPDFRVEWWYVTGWLDGATRPLGFQVTFFRARPELKHDNPSAFTPRHVIIAHAAISDPAEGRLVHAQRAARAGFGLAGAAEDRLHAWLDDWFLERREDGYHCRIPAREFHMNLVLAPAQAPLLQGEGGLSRKGPHPESASYYYSMPHLKVSGSIARGGAARAVAGHAWLDHEWSSRYMEESAVGWDWAGINLADGGALMAFRMRGREGSDVWAGGAHRGPDGRMEIYGPRDVRFTPRRHWTSPRNGARYPVELAVRAGAREFVLRPLFDDQEHDTRATTGTIYWEGAVAALLDGRRAGAGYLELTGYWRRVDL